MPDLIDELAGIVPGDRLDTLRAKRPIARRDAQAISEARPRRIPLLRKRVIRHPA